MRTSVLNLRTNNGDHCQSDVSAPAGYCRQTTHLSQQLYTPETKPQATMPLVGLDTCGVVEDSIGAFQATLLWEKIVMHLERSVKSRRRIRRLRTFEDCFPGSKAVECLTDYLNTILPKTIKQSQVRTLCQKLLLTGVIEDVKSKEKSVFQDGRLYRFTGFHFWEPEAPDGTLMETEKNLESPRGCNAEHNLQETSAGAWKSHCMTLSVRDSPTASSCVVSGKMQKTEDEIMRVANETVHHIVLPQDQCRCTRNAAETQKPHSSVDKPRRRSTICQKLSHFCSKISRKDTVIHKEAQTRDLRKHRTQSFQVNKLSTKESKHFRDSRKTRDKDFAPHSYCDDTNFTQGTVYINMASLHRSHSFSSSSTVSGSTSIHRAVRERTNVVAYGFV